MAKKLVKLLRPLNNQQVGSTATYDQAEAERLAGYGAVEILGDAPSDAEAAKAEPAPANKAKKAPANKAATGRKRTRK